uniref:(northern house mosquito) hypothetical protein n=1 Tax=Culex pipiens TaxID=7175 RepID=A0A8D8AF72_CULPI
MQNLQRSRTVRLVSWPSIATANLPSPELHSCAVKSNVNRVTIHSSRITNVRATARNRCPWNLTKRVILRSSMAAGDRLNQTVGSVRMLRSDLLSAAKKVRPHQD